MHHLHLLPYEIARRGHRAAPIWVIHAAASSGGTSGSAGVSWDKQNKKWTARLKLGGKKHSLGRFAEERDAAAAYQAAREAAAEGRQGVFLPQNL